MTPFSPLPVKISSDLSRQTKQGVGCGYAFCGVFALIGAAMLWFLFLKPLAHVLAARSWATVPCQIQSSAVTPHSGSDGTNYSADMTFAYSYAGQSYVGSRYSFGNPIRGSYNGRAGIIANYPVGSAATCYVNPSSPAESVLQRGLTGDVWLGLVSLPFLGFGIGGMWLMARGVRQMENPKSDWKPQSSDGQDGTLILRPQSSPWGRFVWLGLFTAFWNGIIGFATWDSLHKGHWFVLIFLFIFILVGLLMLAFWVQSLLALCNARPSITLSNRLAVGGNSQLQWQLRGGLFAPSTLQITLEGREEATFTRGTDTITDRSTFYFQTLAQESAARSGSCTLAIPSGTMHSFEVQHNKILWVVRFHGDIPRWPDIEEEWRIAVEPASS